MTVMMPGYVPGLPRRIAWMAGAAGLLLAAILVQFQLCPFARLVRQPCPGCGLTRATIAACEGHFYEAWQHHPLVFIMTPLLAYIMIKNGAHYLQTGSWGRGEATPGWLGRRTTDVIVTIVGALLLGVWIARFFGAFGGPSPV